MNFTVTFTFPFIFTPLDETLSTLLNWVLSDMFVALSLVEDAGRLYISLFMYSLLLIERCYNCTHLNDFWRYFKKIVEFALL